MYNLMYNKIIIFLFMIGSVRIDGITRNTQSEGFLFTKQDRLRIQLSRFNKFRVLGKHECSTLINGKKKIWLIKNIEYFWIKVCGKYVIIIFFHYI